jgi:hypothetical protein
MFVWFRWIIFYHTHTNSVVNSLLFALHTKCVIVHTVIGLEPWYTYRIRIYWKKFEISFRRRFLFANKRGWACERSDLKSRLNGKISSSKVDKSLLLKSLIPCEHHSVYLYLNIRRVYLNGTNRKHRCLPHVRTWYLFMYYTIRVLHFSTCNIYVYYK